MPEGDWVARTALCVTFVLAAVALGGKLSVTGAHNLLGSGFVAACLGLFQIVASLGGRLERRPTMLVGLTLIAYWNSAGGHSRLFGNAPPRSIGTVETLLSPKIGPTRTLEIGDGGTRLVLEGPQGGPLLTIFDKYKPTIKSSNGKLMVSTNVADGNGHLVAQIIRNDGKYLLLPIPGIGIIMITSWGSRTTLAVLFFISVCFLMVQIQGEWWDEDGRESGSKSVPNRRQLADPFWTPRPGDRAIPIIPLFVYPSDKHFGQLVK